MDCMKGGVLLQLQLRVLLKRISTTLLQFCGENNPREAYGLGVWGGLRIGRTVM